MTLEDILNKIESPVKQERLDEFRRRSKENRMRSGSMERAISKRLKGMRVPLSGAGVMKADVFVQMPNGFSYLVECKSSAAIQDNQRVMNVKFDWFTRLRNNVEAMRQSWGVKFGFLVVHCHNVTGDFALIEERDLVYVPAMQEIFNNATLVKVSNTKQHRIYHNATKEQVADGKGYIVHFVKPDVKVLVVHFDTIKEAIHDQYFNDNTEEMGGTTQEVVRAPDK